MSPKLTKIATFGPSHCATPFVLAKLNGEFEREGLQVQLINYSNMPQIAKDLVSGKLDFGQLIVPWVFALHAGVGPFTSEAIPMVITQITGTHGSALMVRSESGIKNVLDFKGKRLSSHSKLSVHYLLAVSFLEREGIRYDRDVEFRIVSLENCVLAMERGEVDASIMPEPKNAILQERGIANSFKMGHQLWERHPCCALVAAVSRAMARAGLAANGEDAREQMVDRLQSTPDFSYDQIPRHVLVRAFSKGRSDFDPFPYQSAGAIVVGLMRQYGLLPRSVDPVKLSTEVFQSDLSRKVLTEVGANPPADNFRKEIFLGEEREFVS